MVIKIHLYSLILRFFLKKNFIFQHFKENLNFFIKFNFILLFQFPFDFINLNLTFLFIIIIINNYFKFQYFLLIISPINLNFILFMIFLMTDFFH